MSDKQKVIDLIQSWLDEDGDYDEKTYAKLEKALSREVDKSPKQTLLALAEFMKENGIEIAEGCGGIHIEIGGVCSAIIRWDVVTYKDIEKAAKEMKE